MVGEQILQIIEQLRRLVQVDVRTGWQICTEEIAVEAIDSLERWQPVGLNEKGNIAWEAGRQVVWLGQVLKVPAFLDEKQYPLTGLSCRLGLRWWAEDAQIYVNGKLVQQGDLFDSSVRVLLSERVQAGDEFFVLIRLVSPGHDRGALVRSVCIYESWEPEKITPGFVAEELAVLAELQPNSLKFLESSLNQIVWNDLDNSLVQFRETLKSHIPSISEKICLLGHAHLDLAWLWPVSETWVAAERTFESVLNLQQDFPDLIFCHSTPALYEWIEENRPELFQAIQEKVKAGTWEVVGGMWVEPDLNLISGESIARQILYGQRYSLEKFGKLMSVCWVPDSFGFCWQLPQFLKQGGVEYFVTQKLRWNDTTQFPYSWFWWQSPDGTKILSFMSALIGEAIEPVKMAKYAQEWKKQAGFSESLWLPGVGDHGGGPTRDMLEIAQKWQTSPFFPKLEFISAEAYLSHLQKQSVFDHSISPNPLLETVSNSPSFQNPENLEDLPVLEDSTSCTSTTGTLETLLNSLNLQNPANSENFSSSEDSTAGTSKTLSNSPYLQNPANLENSHNLPIWNDELYLEFHRGCYTTHAAQKRYNRHCETLLYQAELFASLATLTAGTPYPKTELETAWKQVLFNQFHDILPGSSIPEVYTDANQLWETAQTTATAILEQSLETLAAQISFPPAPHPEARPIILFNSLNWSRSEVVAVEVPVNAESRWQIWDEQGNPIACQLSETPNQQELLLFFAESVPAIGYRVFWVAPQNAETLDKPGFFTTNLKKGTENPGTVSSIAEFDSFVNSGKDWVLENQFLIAKINPNTGNLESLYDKINHKEVCTKPGGNQLQAFQDSGQYWDAWNIDPNYEKHPLPAPELVSIEWIEQEQIRSRIRVVRKLENAEFQQDYILDIHSPLLKIENIVEWNNQHILVKAAFPFTIETDVATYETACGAIQRTTQPQTPQEQAKWEVPAHRWADLSTPDYGVSLLNDCKYGYDAKPHQLRLTLLRGSTWPDPKADQGTHHFTYAIYPHAGTWKDAQTVHRAYELNTPLLSKILPKISSKFGNLPPKGSFLELSGSNLILMAFKPAEASANHWILRGYECHGNSANLCIKSDLLPIKITQAVDLLEQNLEIANPFQLSAWQIRTIKLVIGNG
jgi:alpha-mannosidase